MVDIHLNEVQRHWWSICHQIAINQVVFKKLKFKVKKVLSKFAFLTFLYIFALISDVAEKPNNLILMECKFFKFKDESIERRLNKKVFIRSIFNDDTHSFDFDSAIEWARAEYARDKYFALKKDFYTDVLAKSFEEMSSEEYGSEDGYKMYWNYYLTKLVDLDKKGELFDKTLGRSFGSDCLVLTIFGVEVFFDVDDEFNLNNSDLFDDVSDEYIRKIKKTINQEEIDSFVSSHSQDEIQEKYAVQEFSDEFWSI